MKAENQRSVLNRPKTSGRHVDPCAAATTIDLAGFAQPADPAARR